MSEPSSDVIQYGAGWGTSYEHMSPSLRARCAQADREYDRQSAREAQARAELAARDEQSRIALSIIQAEDRGELFDMREAMRNGGVGRTKAEALAYYSSLSDWQDARERALQAKQIRDHLNSDWYGDTSADMSAPSPAEVAEREQMGARVEEYRAKRRERSKTIQAARRLAQWDRGAR
jgi:hypothetical protein